MKNSDPRVDAYIEQAAPFARPILTHLRRAFHHASPELREDMKWSSPHFVRKGIVAGMAAFKEHAGFGFWRGRDMRDPEGLFKGGAKASMCYVKVSSVVELPAEKVIAAYVKEAIALDDAFEQPAAKRRRASGTRAGVRPAPTAPDDLMAALRDALGALSTYEAFPPGKQREYVDWVTDAKRAETRARRIAQAVEWMAEGKSRNWKYERS